MKENNTTEMVVGLKYILFTGSIVVTGILQSITELDYVLIDCKFRHLIENENRECVKMLVTIDKVEAKIPV